MFAVTGEDNAWQLKSKFFLTVSYSVNIIGFKQFHKKIIIIRLLHHNSGCRIISGHMHYMKEL